MNKIRANSGDSHFIEPMDVLRRELPSESFPRPPGVSDARLRVADNDGVLLAA